MTYFLKLWRSKAIWRAYGAFCKAYFRIVLCGTHEGCSLVQFRHFQDPRNALEKRPRLLALQAARDATAAVETCQLYFANRSDRFHDVVLASHGSHIPFAVRSAATCLFWLPELLSQTLQPRDAEALRVSSSAVCWFDLVGCSRICMLLEL